MSGTIGRAEILGLIPHAGGMCLLDEVLSWDAASIHCRTRSHLDPANPLCRGGVLHALHLIEYGAQAMAIHGGLEARGRGAAAAPGLLVSVRDLKLEVQALQDLAAPLDIHAEQLLAQPGGWLYQFRAEANGRLLGSGRVMVKPRP